MTGATATLLQRLAGIFMVILGLVIGDWVKIPSLLSDTRKNNTSKTTSFASSFFIGLGFAAGWTPCIGPIFSGILLLGLSTGTTPIVFLLLYIIGFSLPFLLVSLFLGKMQSLLKYSEKLMKIGGVLMIVMGILLFTGQLEFLSEQLSIWLQDTPFQWLG